jgi:N-acetyl sugar amidotransferase
VAYRTCTRCVMDTTAADIVFDADGVCNYCTDYLRRLQTIRQSAGTDHARRDAFIDAVKAQGKSKEYDCIVGVSGGVDSSYALYLAVANGLRPLAVHLDNGWNSELASHNIASLISRLGVDLYTHVIDWEENRDLQLSFFKANVIDIELLMDNAMLALNYQQAARFGVKFILAGTNIATEGMPIPSGWNHFKTDARNIRRIQRRFGQLPIKTHPLFSTIDYVWYEFVRRIRWVSFLDYFPYNKLEALETLKTAIGYKPYPYKHYESVFTRFYQGHILPHKFGIDKRRPHLSTLIVSGQLTRAEAVKTLHCSPYPDPRQEEQDRIFVMKKLGFSNEAFTDYLAAAGVPHDRYGSERRLRRALGRVQKALRTGRG